MKKKAKSSPKKSIITLSVVLLLLIPALIFTFLSFSYGEDGIKEYRSVVGAIDKGIDIDGGFSAVLEPVTPVTQTEKSNFNANIKEAVKIINKRLDIKYTGASAVEQTSANGDKSIRVELPKSSSIQNAASADSVFSSLIRPAVIEFKIKDKDDAFLENSDFKKFDVIINSSNNHVVFRLSKDGNKKLQETTQANIGKEMEIYVDGEVLTSTELKETLTTDPVITTGTKEQAEVFAMQLNGGALPFKFQSFETKEISPSLGQNAVKSILTACIIGVCLLIAFMFAIYRGFGITFALSLLIFIVILLFIVSQLPGIQLTLPVIIAIMLSIGMTTGANITIFERIREEYSSGKSLKTSVNNGFKRVVATILDFNIVTLILAIMLLILGSGYIKSFAIILAVGITLSVIICFTVTRLLAKLLLPFSNEPKFYGLKRGIIEDEV